MKKILPRKLTLNLKITSLERRSIFQSIILGIQPLVFRRCKLRHLASWHMVWMLHWLRRGHWGWTSSKVCWNEGIWHKESNQNTNTGQSKMINLTGHSWHRLVYSMYYWVVVLNMFYFHPYLGRWSNWTNIFQMGWNHQLANHKNRCFIPSKDW